MYSWLYLILLQEFKVHHRPAASDLLCISNILLSIIKERQITEKPDPNMKDLK